MSYKELKTLSKTHTNIKKSKLRILLIHTYNQGVDDAINNDIQPVVNVVDEKLEEFLKLYK